MINRDPSERLGHQRPGDIKEHPFFSKAEITDEEERYYMMLEEDRIKQQEAVERAARISMPALSRATKRLSMLCGCMSLCVYQGSQYQQDISATLHEFLASYSSGRATCPLIRTYCIATYIV